MHPDNMKINLKRGDELSDVSSTKKSSGARPSRDFKKVYDDGDLDEQKKTVDEKELYEPNEELAQDTKPAKTPSLFDLSSQASSTPKPNPHLESPASMFQKMAKTKGSEEELAAEEYPATNLNGVDQKDLSKKGRIPSQFAQERQDLAFVNPLTTNMDQKAVGANVGKVDVVSTVNHDLHDLVEKIMDRVVVMQKGGETETLIKIPTENNTMFRGANIVLSEFDYAKGEFNIRFENLTNQAQNFMVLRENQDSLRQALFEAKGFVAHIITATTQVETPYLAAEARPQERGQDSNPDQQQQRQRRQGGQDQT